MKHGLRLAVAIAATLSIVTFVLQAAVLRPHLYPAGAGLTASGDAVLNELSEHPTVSFAHLPDLRGVLGRPVAIAAVWPGGEADRAGLRVGAQVLAVTDATGQRVDLGGGLPDDAAAAMDLWARSYRMPPTGPVTLRVRDTPGSTPRDVTLERPTVWSLDIETIAAWFWQFHGLTLAKHLVYTLSALLIVVLGARGRAATLITLAFLLMGATDVGPLMGAEWRVPPISGALVAFSWSLTAVSFPIIGLALIYFPSRGTLLERHRWMVYWLWIASLPLGLIGTSTTAFLLGADRLRDVVAWLALNPWVFNTSFAVGLATNIALLGVAVQRYLVNPDAVERRRIQTIMVTAVPGMVAYALAAGVPLVARSLGLGFHWPWQIAVVLQFLVLLSAFGLAYAVAVRRAMSPRTVLRQGLQYALARKTLAVLTTLPALLLVGALIRQSDRPLSDIVRGRPAFYIGSLVLIALGLRYRTAAQQWLDRRFFRSEYDAREILLTLASRVPHETDPRTLLSLVLTDVESALHPASLTVLVESAGMYQVIEARHLVPGPLPAAAPGPSPAGLLGPLFTGIPAPLPAGSGLAQLLQWSDAPLEVFLDDQRSAIARLPTADREWLRASGAALLVPIFAGTSVERPLIGVILLGPKRSEESFTGEDRRLLAGIAAQIGLALDLSRLRRQAEATPRGRGDSPAPESATRVLPPSVDVGVTIDGKYRVDALIGRGGMGAVYRARDTRLDRDVAVKVVRGELVASAAARERFKREAQLAARLHHPSIVTVFDYGTLPDGAAYLVMEYVRGEDLRARLTRGTLDRREAVRLVSAVAEGVDAAHREQVLHRDLKPENVLLPETGGPPKVLDFGVAKLMESGAGPGTLTGGATIVGTPAYMAPEQLRGSAVDARADVYSLAVMAYELLTGQLPFGAGSFVDVAVRQADEAPLDAVALPERAVSVLRRGLSADPARRPATAVAFAAELRQVLEPQAGR